VYRRGEAAHVKADFGEDRLSAGVRDAGHRRYLLDGGSNGPEVGLHLLVDRGHGRSEGIDLIEMEAQQETVLLRQYQRCQAHDTNNRGRGVLQI